MQDNTEGEFFLQSLRTSTAGSISPPYGLPRTETLRRAIFNLWSRPWDVARQLGLRGIPNRPHPSERVG